MKTWDYVNDVPFIPVIVDGPRLSVGILALVNTGAKYCVAHEKLATELGLKKTDEARLSGFGSDKKFRAGLCEADVEIEKVEHKVLVAVITANHYPFVAPKFILERSFLNNFKITLDGRKRKISLE